MQRRIKQSLTVFMAFLILLSSTGFAFIEHECMMRGKSMKFSADEVAKSVAKKKVSSCCAKAKSQKEVKGTFFKKTECCKDSQKFEKVDVAPSISQMFAKALKIISDGVLWSLNSLVFVIAEWVLPSVSNSPSISFSSLFHGRNMLCFIQSFLI